MLIPTREDLSRLLTRARGELSTEPFALVMLAIITERSTGLLTLTHDTLEKKISFENGNPIDCRSNIQSETLGRFLVSRGLLEEEVLDAVNLQARQEGSLFGEILVRKGLITPYDLYRELQQNLSYRLLDAFTWREGRWAMGEPATVANPLQINGVQILMSGLPRSCAAGDEKRLVDSFMGRHLALTPYPPIDIQDLKLTTRQAQVVNALRQFPTLEDLAAKAQMDGDELQRLLYALAFFGVLIPEDALPPVERERAQRIIDRNRVRETGQSSSRIILPNKAPGGPETVTAPTGAASTTSAGPAPTPPSVNATGTHRPTPGPMPAYSPARPGPSTTQSGSVYTKTIEISPPSTKEADTTVRPGIIDSERRNFIMQQYVGARQKDPFDLLKLDSGANSRQLTEAYLRFAEQTAPWQYSGELREKAMELFLAGAKAYATLSDEKTRAELIKQRSSGLRPAARPPSKSASDSFVVKSDFLDAGKQYKVGVSLLEQEQYAKALEHLQLAVDFESNNVVFRAALAFNKASIDTGHTDRYINELKTMVGEDPHCGTAHLYLGRLLYRHGDNKKAEEMLRKAASLLPGDPRPRASLKQLMGL